MICGNKCGNIRLSQNTGEEKNGIFKTQRKDCKLKNRNGAKMKNAEIKIRVSEVEKESIKKRAIEKQMSLSEYILYCVRAKEDVVNSFSKNSNYPGMVNPGCIGQKCKFYEEYSEAAVNCCMFGSSEQDNESEKGCVD